jgi:hypothetical protein
MKKALISPDEIIDNNERVAQVEQASTIFEVASPLYWIDCPDYVTANDYVYNEQNNEFIRVTPEVVPTAEQNKKQATDMLYETDWTTIPDVANPALSNPYLANQAAFIAWREEIRQFVFNPVAGDYPFPQRPVEDWQPAP